MPNPMKRVKRGKESSWVAPVLPMAHGIQGIQLLNTAAGIKSIQVQDEIWI